MNTWDETQETPLETVQHDEQLPQFYKQVSRQGRIYVLIEERLNMLAVHRREQQEENQEKGDERTEIL